MTDNFRPTALVLALAAAFPACAQAVAELAPVIVTAPAMDEPLAVSFDPKAPQQPLPANDGASLLKSIPGMSVTRKGGTDGDPAFRGMAASRLNILLDGEMILGGCGNRMDPPTAYVFPETYDRVTLLKGPQTVLYGPGNSAGTVLFEKKPTYFPEAGWKLNGSLMGGSFGRHDEVLDFQGGNSGLYFRGSATNSQSEDYKDGDGKKIHSGYERWSTNAAFGWTPDADTRVEFSAIRSDAKAAYADRTMDGTKFERENYGLRFDKKNVSALVERIEAQAYYNYVDHVMDNYSLRRLPASIKPMVSNPDRETLGGRVALTLRPGDASRAVLGIDTQSNKHTVRSTMNQAAMPYESMARLEDASFDQQGLFGEWTQFLGERDRIIAGLRGDWWQAQDKRQTLRLSTGTVANPTAGASRDEVLSSGFARYEHDLVGGPTLYGGLGHSERFPDYWELIGGSKESLTSTSAFASVRPEKTTQLDLGANWKAGPWSGFVSGFYNRINDYILIESKITKGTRTGITVARNVDATTWGGEAGVSYRFTDNLKGDASLAYVRGENDSENRPLGQIAPLEGRLGLAWDNRVWSAGALLRLVAAQDRYALNEGNIVGQDIGKTGGFGVFSINGGYRPAKGVLIAAGIDNLFDKTYAEHISRAGAMVAGFDQTLRVNEPGRTVWLKASMALE